MLNNKSLFKIALLSALFFSVQNAKAQGIANHWFFGAQAGIEFTTGAPVANINGQLNTFEGCASISNNAGTLLFYTDGVTVYNSNHLIMANGTGLLGNFSSTQSAVIVPAPGSNSIYYIFTVGITGPICDIRYSQVDMTLNGGLGGVLNPKNVLLTNGDTEKLCVIKHQNNSNYWIIDADRDSCLFRSYELSPAGINTTPVISSFGPIAAGIGQRVGYLKASSDGTQMVSACTGLNISYLMDFDPATGLLTNKIDLSTTVTGSYGAEFSPSGRFLYISGVTLTQFDLQQPTTALINSTAYVVSAASTGIGALQLGPDGKIYHTRPNVTSLSAINNPDSVGVAMGYLQNAVWLGGKIARIGLPTFINQVFGTINSQNFCFNDSTIFQYSGDTVGNSLLWRFGDPLSGSADTSSSWSPKHIFSDTGTFEVQLIISDTNQSDTILHEIRIDYTPNTSLGNDTSICQGEQVNLDATNPLSWNTQYMWGDGSTSPIKTINGSGQYKVTVSSGGCSKVDSIGLTVKPIPALNLGADVIICDGQTKLLDATFPLSSYSWSNGSTGPTLLAQDSGLYWVISNLNGCENTDSIYIGYKPNPMFSLPSDTNLCDADTLNIGVFNSGATYLWSTGITGSNQLVTGSGQYSVTVDLNGCKISKSFRATYYPIPAVYLGRNFSLCDQQDTTLSVARNGGSYLWQDGSTEPTFKINGAGIYSVIVSENGCSFIDSIQVAYYPYPSIGLPADTFLCQGQELLLEVPSRSDDGQYRISTIWQDGTIGSGHTFASAGTYRVTSRIHNCKFSLGFTVQEVELPRVDLGNDTAFCLDKEVGQLSSESGYSSYAWSDGQMGDIIDIEFPGLYTITVSNEYGCVNTDEIEVINECPVYLFIPNSFSPNGDGINDQFLIKGKGYAAVEVTIINRWGEQVYFGQALTTGWDGSYQDKLANQDVYAVEVRYLPFGSTDWEFKQGRVLLLRE